jgi:Clusterin-associated protein-1
VANGVQELARATDTALAELSSLDRDAKSAQGLLADITNTGAEIYEGLSKEGQLKAARNAAVAKQTDRSDVDRAIQVRSRASKANACVLRSVW